MLAFTEWGVLAYVITGLVFAVLFLALFIANRRANHRNRRSEGCAVRHFQDCAEAPDAGHPPSPGRAEVVVIGLGGGIGGARRLRGAKGKVGRHHRRLFISPTRCRAGRRGS